jgi:hypothetical protein
LKKKSLRPLCLCGKQLFKSLKNQLNPRLPTDHFLLSNSLLKNLAREKTKALANFITKAFDAKSFCGVKIFTV